MLGVCRPARIFGTSTFSQVDHPVRYYSPPLSRITFCWSSPCPIDPKLNRRVQHISITSLTTFLLPLYDRRSTCGTYLPDRTFLGGPNSIRGWKVGGLGLRDGQDSLGGDLAWALGASLFSPLPRLAHWPLRLHSFLNVGKVVGYDSGESSRSLGTARN